MNTQSNKRMPGRFGLMAVLAIFALMGLSWGLFFFADSEVGPASEEAAAPPPPPPDLPTLAAAMRGGTTQPSPEDLEEERQLREGQVEFAAQLMAHPDAESRAAGAEQLSAYPTEAAEKQLAAALATDIDAAVRAAAAQSLGAFKAPKDESLDALFSGMLDADRSVRRNALNSLQRYVGREPRESARRGQILDKFGQLAKSRQLQPDTQAAVQSFLADQAPSGRPAQ